MPTETTLTHTSYGSRISWGGGIDYWIYGNEATALKQLVEGSPAAIKQALLDAYLPQAKRTIVSQLAESLRDILTPYLQAEDSKARGNNPSWNRTTIIRQALAEALSLPEFDTGDHCPLCRG